MRSDASMEKARATFRKRMILTLAEVAELIDSTIHTARRRLQQWGVINSYNHNGRYYALADVPEFDGHGLWRCRGVFFSRYGNLKQTVVELVRRSPAGLDAGELRSLLGVDPRSFLSALAKHPQMKREKSRGRFVYYGADPHLHQKQRERRWAWNAMGRQPTPSEAVAILVEKIKHPALSHEAISRRLKKQNLSVPPQVIESFFIRHDLAVKKTSRSV